MKQYDVILFDLDGTLVDSGLGIKNAVIYAMNRWGIEIPDESVLRKFVGPPIPDAFGELYGFSKEEGMEILNTYREYYSEKGLFECCAYDGMEETLKMLKDLGKTLGVATLKPQPYAECILETLGLDSYFTAISGAPLNNCQYPKTRLIEDAMRLCDISDFKKVLMVGDRKFDTLAAKKLGVDSIGALYGYGSYEELKTSGATYLVENVKQLKSFFQL